MESDFRNEAPEGFFLTSVPFEGKKTFQTEYELLDLIGKGMIIILIIWFQILYLRHFFGS